VAQYSDRSAVRNFSDGGAESDPQSSIALRSGSHQAANRTSKRAASQVGTLEFHVRDVTTSKPKADQTHYANRTR